MSLDFQAIVPRKDDAGSEIEGVTVGGRIDYLSPNEFASEMENVRDWVEDSWIAEFPDELEFWENAAPFCRIINGDYLALRPRQGSWEVVYLSHDETSETLAPSLSKRHSGHVSTFDSAAKPPIYLQNVAAQVLSRL